MLVLAAAAAVTLTAAPAASAKQITKAQVCGPDSCATVDDQQARAARVDGGPPRTPPGAAPFYDVRITMAEGDQTHRFGFVAVPSKGALRADDGTWMVMPPELVALVRKLAGDQKPFPASQLTGAAPPPEPRPASAASGDDSPLWPEGAIIALIAIVASAGVVRFSNRYRPASG
jgi:hypothetical protein